MVIDKIVLAAADLTPAKATPDSRASSSREIESRRDGERRKKVRSEIEETAAAADYKLEATQTINSSF